MKKKRTSLKDIAEAVGVSVSLVSYVLNNKGEENRVAKKTAERIRQVAKELNYRPNQIARSLKSKKTQTIGLIVADISNPFFANLARTIEDDAHSKNHTVIFGSSDESKVKFKKVLDFFATRQVDGFIIAATEGCRDTILELKKSKVPFVLVDRYFEDISTNCVIIDNFQASLDATNFLLAKGHTRIGFISYQSDLIHFHDRINGYKEALRRSGIPRKDVFVKTVTYSNFRKDMERAIRELIRKHKVEAIFFSTNTLALKGLKQLFDLNIKVSEELDVVAFDQSVAYEFFEHFIPHIKQPIKTMGKEAVKVLIDQINEPTTPEQQICLQATLVTASAKKLEEG